ncbi:MAG: HDOD domain-containing protein [Rhodocyclaceae bacterium]|nr:HDOD domain-containing protein [Rhodocyclaceae bacterium]
MSMMADDPVFIPSSVRAAITIRNAAEDPCINDVAIQRMVAAEPTVAAALLRLANSATYRRGKLVESVADAVMLLGMGEVRAVASQVAMLQIVRGIRGRAARLVAENLLLHSISVSTFAEQIARGIDGCEPGRVATLGLFHEMPTFLLLAGSNQSPEKFETLADISRLAETVPLRSFELLMQDFGLHSLAIPRVVEAEAVEQAHLYVTHPNPLRMHPLEGGERKGMAPEQIVLLQAMADAAYVTLVEGPLPASRDAHPPPCEEMLEMPVEEADGEPVTPPQAPPRGGLVAKLQAMLGTLFGSR